MSKYVQVIKKQAQPHASAIKDDIEARRDKDFFWPTGTQVYIGRQGSGKTISAVHHLESLRKRYPKAKVVSNLVLNHLKKITVPSDPRTLKAYEEAGMFDTVKHYYFFTTIDELATALTGINNDKYGVIFIIDEIHTYFNSLESKNIPPFIFTEISQQRKQRKSIIGTSQLFNRMAKPFREQVDNIIVCGSMFGVFTHQRAIDGETLSTDDEGNIRGVTRKRGFFFHSRQLRGLYDTYQKVVSSDLQLEENPVSIVQQSKSKNHFLRRN